MSIFVGTGTVSSNIRGNLDLKVNCMQVLHFVLDCSVKSCMFSETSSVHSLYTLAYLRATQIKLVLLLRVNRCV